MNEQNSPTKDREIRLTRIFNAPIELMWEVWTNPDHLQQWWGPHGFTNTISKYEVVNGGAFNLVMHGPDGTNYDNKFVFTEVVPLQKLQYDHITGPKFTATVTFEKIGNTTKIDWHMVFATREIFIQTVKTFKADEGLKQNGERLEAYINTRFQLLNDKKPNKMARVSFYVNFPGNTEDALNFYKGVFRTEFIGGIQRFGDIPTMEGMPPLSEQDKKLIIHAEIPLLGGHVLMATDAAESMGFKVATGNNMHINLEPDSRDEAKRIFDELSDGGTISMPIQDMFWGAYFGSFTDKFGINWMVNYTPAQ